MLRRTIPSLLLVLALLAACGPGSGDGRGDGGGAGTVADTASRASIEVQGEPAVGPAAIIVRLMEDGAAVTGAEVEVTGDMTHAGMMPVIAPAEEVEPGLYRTGGFEFTMGGDWILTADFTTPDGSSGSAQRVLTVPSR